MNIKAKYVLKQELVSISHSVCYQLEW